MCPCFFKGEGGTWEAMQVASRKGGVGTQADRHQGNRYLRPTAGSSWIFLMSWMSQEPCLAFRPSGQPCDKPAKSTCTSVLRNIHIINGCCLSYYMGGNLLRSNRNTKTAIGKTHINHKGINESKHKQKTYHYQYRMLHYTDFLQTAEAK